MNRMDLQLFNSKFISPFSIDATFEKSFGRFVNDSPPQTANSVIKRQVVAGVSRLCIFANKDIDAGTEITYVNFRYDAMIFLL